MKKKLSKVQVIFLTFILLDYVAVQKTFAQKGISTVNQGNTGNWYEKLHWWKKAKPKYEDLVALLAQIKRSRDELIERRITVVNKFDDLIKSLKIDLKNFENKINEHINKINQKLEEESADLEETDPGLLTDLTENSKLLESLKNDFELMILLKNRIDEAVLNTLAGQVQLAESYEDNALNSFEQIENVLDDKKARLLYEAIENSNDNIRAIKNYVNGPLKNYLIDATIKLDQVINRVRQEVVDLQNKDIYLRDLTEEELQRLKEKEEKKQQEEKPKEKPKKQPESIGFWQNILNTIGNFFRFLLNLIKAPFNYFFS